MPILEPAVAAFVLLFFASMWAGAQNALAGGGSFITLPVLMLTGLDPRAANIASAAALFPSQAMSGWQSRGLAAGVGRVRLTHLILISLAGGAVGAGILLLTPVKFFAQIVPWLVLFATTVFAWGSFGPKPAPSTRTHDVRTALIQFVIGIYGGYFGGGNGFLMMAALTMAGQGVRTAGATKNVAAAAMNLTAVVIFLVMGKIRWLQVAVAAAGALIGGFAGVWLLRRLDEKVLRVAIVVIGAALAIGLFLREYR